MDNAVIIFAPTDTLWVLIGMNKITFFKQFHHVPNKYVLVEKYKSYLLFLTNVFTLLKLSHWNNFSKISQYVFEENQGK